MSRVLILGGGLIGAGWAAAFAGAGHETVVLDPAPDAAERCARVWDEARPVLAALGRPAAEVAPRVVARAEEAGPAHLVQEALPEDLALKHRALIALEPFLPSDAVVASSSSGLTAEEIAAPLQQPDRLLIAHPCNPPYLMPTVEIATGPRTSEVAAAKAVALYTGMGKTVLQLKRPVPGHLVNRLQAALWREAVHLVAEGVASVEDVERAVRVGLAPRWCLMGPSAVFHLADETNGMAGFCRTLGPAFERLWGDLGEPSLDEEVARILDAGMRAADPRPVPEIAAARDRDLPRLMTAVADLSGGAPEVDTQN
ncbi:3-hydroxyacyl-CoA dehydrogenase NAD-binding domain-containing protein [Tropicimonas sp. IMCC34011]|uniref:3-hydroxyacyl-CoA dehydrogenase NAD-binding domain-containing protein n=1 Tax=Tropicimonas sp. IMCC34011 TaxID=2248759 RepID=UPI000E27AE9F|nr:3-hydroxyacyl-CoA dehydrogenase NAD-binding domain-containing protein [Tropicimonas sp. IMCC34011]